MNIPLCNILKEAEEQNNILHEISAVEPLSALNKRAIMLQQKIHMLQSVSIRISDIVNNIIRIIHYRKVTERNSAKLDVPNINYDIDGQVKQVIIVDTAASIAPGSIYYIRETSCYAISVNGIIFSGNMCDYSDVANEKPSIINRNSYKFKIRGRNTIDVDILKINIDKEINHRTTMLMHDLLVLLELHRRRDANENLF